MPTQDLLPFRPPTLADVQAIRSCTLRESRSDLAAANIYLLRHKYDTQLLFHMEHLLRFYPGKGRLQGYTFPIGGCPEDVPACLEAIKRDATARHTPLRFCLLTEREARYIEHYFEGRVVINCDSGDADYLYLRTDLAELPGIAFHKKRNRLAAFKRKFPAHSFSALNSQNKDIAWQIAKNWLDNREGSPALQHELNAIEQALTHFEALHLCGGLAYVDGMPVGMCIASFINPSVADIHYEKCLPDYKDTYVFINNQMACLLETELINREEDLNIPGLRSAKLAYNPSMILKKFSATIC